MRTTVSCLSVRQPWAWLIVHGYKDIENRTWPTRHRGDTVIHAGLVFDNDGLLWVQARFPQLRPLLPSQKAGGWTQKMTCSRRSA